MLLLFYLLAIFWFYGIIYAYLFKGVNKLANMKDIIDYLSMEYRLHPRTISGYYEMLKQSPLFEEADAMECLTMLWGERVTESFLYKQQLEENRRAHENNPIRVNSLETSIENTLRFVYSYKYEAMERAISFGTLLLYDENEFDIMERDDQLFAIAVEYFNDSEAIRSKWSYS